MVVLYQPLSIWIQLASFFFTLSGVHGDLLVIRLFLLLAYVMLFLNSILGSPLWPNAADLGGMFLDSLIWSIIGLYVHGASLLCFILDERTVRLTDDEAALWRLFYRTGGLSARLFQTIVSPYLHVLEVDANVVVPTDTYFYVVYSGCVRLQVFDGDDIKVDRNVISGQMFDIKYLGMFSPESVFFSHDIRCQTLTKTRLYRFSRDDMKKIAHHNFAKGVWQALVINELSMVVENYLQKQPVASWDTVDKVFAPLQDWELPDPMLPGSGSALTNLLKHFWVSFLRQLALPSPFGRHPTGLRQVQLPAPPAARRPDGQYPQSRFYRFTSILRKSTVAGEGQSRAGSFRFVNRSEDDAYDDIEACSHNV